MSIVDGRRILVVDDDPQIVESIQVLFTLSGYDVRSVGDGEAALAVFRRWNPELIITDLIMPRMGGLELCRAIRSSSDIPIIIISVKGQESVKVEALESGADDYVTKPFGMNELLARVRAAFRRISTASIRTQFIEAGDFWLDLSAYRAKICGKEVHLTPKEFELLTFLLRNAGRVLTHKALLLAIWGRTYVDQPQTVRVLVRQLRQKIEPCPNTPRYLKSEPWIGYRFEPSK